MKNPEFHEKNCAISCDCADQKIQNSKEKIEVLSNIIPEKTPEKKPESDPTRFGDWQINGRAIDF
jgi:hypothetical protein